MPKSRRVWIFEVAHVGRCVPPDIKRLSIAGGLFVRTGRRSFERLSLHIKMPEFPRRLGYRAKRLQFNHSAEECLLFKPDKNIRRFD